MPYTYRFPRPAVTCDSVVFTVRAKDLLVLLVRRKDDPFQGCWALPGGFVNENESLAHAAARELEEETGLGGLALEQLGAFGDPGRDPRGHTVTVAFVGFLVAETGVSAGDDADAAAWVPLRSLDLTRVATSRAGRRRANAAGGSLAFDHGVIVRRAYERLCRHLDDPVRDTSFDLLPARFTLVEVRRTYEVILGRRLSPVAFRRALVDRGLAVPVGNKPVPRPSAQLYRWNRRS